MSVFSFYDIEQTNQCNLACPCCSNRLRLRTKGRMSPDVFADIAKQIGDHMGAKRRRARVCLHGLGEPLLSPHLDENLSLLDSMGFRNVDLSTNGMLLNDTMITMLCEHPCLSWVRVSLNSSIKEVAEKIQGDLYDFDRVVSNIKNLQKSSPGFRIVVQQMSVRGVSESPRDMLRLVGDGVSVKRKTYHTFANLVPPNDLAYSRPHEGCVFSSHLFIHWDGDIVGCCIDDTKSQVIGHVSDGIFSEKMLARRMHLRERLEKEEFGYLPMCARCKNA